MAKAGWFEKAGRKKQHSAKTRKIQRKKWLKSLTSKLFSKNEGSSRSVPHKTEQSFTSNQLNSEVRTLQVLPTWTTMGITCSPKRSKEVAPDCSRFPFPKGRKARGGSALPSVRLKQASTSEMAHLCLDHIELELQGESLQLDWNH